MKLKLRITSVLIFLVFSQLNAQYAYSGFEEAPEFRMWKDSSIANKNWQIGTPSKTKFKWEKEYKHVLLTDTALKVLPGDTFSNIIEFSRMRTLAIWDFILMFEYQLDGDSLDRAMVEMSLDKGQSWINLLDEDTTYDINWHFGKPVMRGDTQGWVNFYADMNEWVHDRRDKYPKSLRFVDTVLYRLTYIVDSSSSGNREGWMIDNFAMINGYESIHANYTDGGFTCYPNPSEQTVFIKNVKEKTVSGIALYNAFGQMVLSLSADTITEIDVSQLPNGIYSALIYSEEQYYSLRISVSR